MPSIDETLTMVPRLRPRIPGSTRRRSATAPKKFTSNCARTSRSSCSSMAPRKSIAALLTRTSMLPRRASVSMPDDPHVPRGQPHRPTDRRRRRRVRRRTSRGPRSAPVPRASPSTRRGASDRRAPTAARSRRATQSRPRQRCDVGARSRAACPSPCCGTFRKRRCPGCRPLSRGRPGAPAELRATPAAQDPPRRHRPADGKGRRSGSGSNIAGRWSARARLPRGPFYHRAAHRSVVGLGGAALQRLGAEFGNLRKQSELLHNMMHGALNLGCIRGTLTAAPGIGRAQAWGPRGGRVGCALSRAGTRPLGYLPKVRCKGSITRTMWPFLSSLP
jgi:hypothetical protein